MWKVIEELKRQPDMSIDMVTQLFKDVDPNETVPFDINQPKVSSYLNFSNDNPWFDSCLP